MFEQLFFHKINTLETNRSTLIYLIDLRSYIFFLLLIFSLSPHSNFTHSKDTLDLCFI